MVSFSGKAVMHDPFAMRPFFGYNVGDYFQHWLDFQKTPGLKLPKIFHVNWFRTDDQDEFLWPGFGENTRVLDWVLKRCDGDDVAQMSPIGLIPKEGSLKLDGLEKPVDTKALFEIPKDFWLEEVEDIRKYFDDQINDDLPPDVASELDRLEERIRAM